MSPFEGAAILGAVCGTAMVFGGIWLVAKGVITLAATPQAEALSIEWKKQFRMNTQVPGLAFFLVGLLFIYISLLFLKPVEVPPFEVAGELKGMDQPWSISIRPQNNWQEKGSSARRFNTRIYPEVSSLIIEVTAPGYEPFEKSITITPRNKRTEDLGTLVLRRVIKKEEIARSVASLPFDATAPGAASRATFGEPK